MSKIVLFWKGYMYIVEKNETHENDIEHHARAWWLVKNYNKAPLQELVPLSYIWSSVKHYGVKYDNAIMDRLKEFENVYVA